MTDPQRTPDPMAIAQKLPKGATLIYRHFGDENREKLANSLRNIDGLTLLIGNDPKLAKTVGADGVHMPRSTSADTLMDIRNAHPDWIITQAAAKTEGMSENLTLDALFVSAVFSSKSPSAGQPIGLGPLTEIALKSPMPIYALGGITSETAPHLIGSGVAGFAAIDGIVKEINLSENRSDSDMF